MKKISLSLFLLFVFCLAASAAASGGIKMTGWTTNSSKIAAVTALGTVMTNSTGKLTNSIAADAGTFRSLASTDNFTAYSSGHSTPLTVDDFTGTNNLAEFINTVNGRTVLINSNADIHIGGGTFYGNAAGLTNVPSGSTPIQSILFPNLPGPTRGITFRNGAPEGTGFHQAPPQKGLVYFGAGVSGVISSFKWTDATGHDSDGLLRSNLVLRVYVDAGDIADPDNISTNYITVAAPINMMINAVWRPVTGTPQIKNTRYLDSQDILGSGNIGFNLKLPILFTNGVFIGIYNEHGTNTVYNFSSANYKLGPLNFPGSNYRLRSSFFHAISTNEGGNGGYAGVPGVAQTFLTVSNTPGFLAGISYANKGTTNGSEWPEGNWMFTSDAPNANIADAYLYSDIGGEDLFFNSYYFANGININYDFGTVYVATPVVAGITYNIRMEGYRWFTPAESPTWTTSFYGSRIIHTDTTNDVEDFLSWYYAPGGAPAVIYTNPVPFVAVSPFDVDALDFMTRVAAANVTLGPSQQAALNQLVVNMKTHGMWAAATNVVVDAALYVHINGETNNVFNNLVKGWEGHGTYTDTSAGFTGNGVNGYYDTRWNPSALSYPSTNVMYYVYAKTNNSPGSLTMPMGNSPFWYNRLYFVNGGGSLQWDAIGPNGDSSPASAGNPLIITDYNLCSERTNSTTISTISGGGSRSAASADKGQQNGFCFVGADSNGGSPIGFYPGTICVSLNCYGVVNASIITQFETDVTAFNAALGR
jgi:hypothetical protein